MSSIENWGGLLEAAREIAARRREALGRLRDALANDDVDELRAAAVILIGVDNEKRHRADSGLD